jgi:hypothetical protein
MPRFTSVRLEQSPVFSGSVVAPYRSRPTELQLKVRKTGGAAQTGVRLPPVLLSLRSGGVGKF